MNPANLVAVDTETTGLDLRHDCRPFMVTTCDLEGRSRVWEWDVCPYTRQPEVPENDLQEIREHLSGKTLVFHHAKFDIRALETIGIYFFFQKSQWVTIKEINVPITICEDFHDTLLMSHALSTSDKHGLKELGVKYLQYSSSDEKKLKEQVAKATRRARLKFKNPNLGHSPQGKRQTGYDYWLPRAVDPKNDVCRTYAIKDVERTILLYDFFNQLLDEEQVYNGYLREKALLEVVYKMETGGITVNTIKINKKIKELQNKEMQLKKSCQEHMEALLEKSCNPDSGKDLTEFLFSRKGLTLSSVKLTDKGNPSTDKEALNTLASDESLPKSAKEFLHNLLEARTYSSGRKYLINYQSYAVPQHGKFSRLYPSLNQTGTRTTRFSSNNPNGQNCSKISTVEVGNKTIEGPRLRDTFGPTPNNIWYAIDYSQLELRVFAACSQEQSLIDALDAGYDFHGYVAQRIFNKPADKVTKQERRIAKNTNFAIIFGAGPDKVNKTAGIPNAYELFAGQFPNVHSYMTKTIRYAKKHNYVRTLDGYRIDVSPEAPYKAVNYLVQGTAGSIIKNAMIQIDKQKIVDWVNSRIVLQIHDELIIELRKEKVREIRTIARIIKAMENAGAQLDINTPVSVEKITSDWGHGAELPRTHFFRKAKS